MNRLPCLRRRAGGEKLLDRERVELVRPLAELARHLDGALLAKHVAHLIGSERAEQTGNSRWTATTRELDRRALEHAQVPLPEAPFEHRLERGMDQIGGPHGRHSSLRIPPGEGRG